MPPFGPLATICWNRHIPLHRIAPRGKPRRVSWHLDRDGVLRLPATSGGDRPSDVRDRAILIVPVACGLRSGEVAGLRLDDPDRTEEILQVRRPKPGRTHLHPLSRGVGQAIQRYVRDGRPRRPDPSWHFFRPAEPVRADFIALRHYI